MSLHQWFLTFKTADELTQLFTLVNANPNNVFYFCTNKINKEKAIQWLDELPNLIRTTFTFNQHCEICEHDDKDPVRSYHEAAPAEHTSDAVSGFDKLLKGAMDTVNDKEKENTAATDKDHLSNCWKLPPRLVYSKFLSSGSETQPSTLSRNTNSISSFGNPVTQLANYAIIQCANKQLTE
eukprot:9765568-Ditylum_brightwellii.AAC.1